MIESTSGRIAKPATSFDKVAIPNGADVLVVDVQNGVLQVAERNELERYI
jgi:hypothetical protein